MNLPIRVFVGVVFAAMATAFVGLSAVLYNEYHGVAWFALATFDSQLFLFFPLFGVLALLAFYLPACVLVDIYWRHVDGGRLLLSISLVVIALLSPFVAQQLSGSAKALWDLSPQSLRADKGESCYPNLLKLDDAGLPIAGPSGSCKRLPFLLALRNLREVTRSRMNMSPFVRGVVGWDRIGLSRCRGTEKLQHYCFANNQMQTAKDCCAAQMGFSQAIIAKHAEQRRDTATRNWFRWLMPFHIFFLLLIFGLGIALIRRGKWLDLPEYDDVRARVEARILVGGVALMFWPLLNHSFLQSAAILYGTETQSAFRNIAPVFTVIFGTWTLMLLFFYFRAFPDTLRRMGAGYLVSSAVRSPFSSLTRSSALCRDWLVRGLNWRPSPWCLARLRRLCC